ncbi:hypothetical protein DY124_07830 [Apilactobacillus micheneri]|nr:hypothetical protein DY124_07830 [Apilactobacillus micheneri]TPR47002.1 hypothetical protein DY125_07780 [Apilactobacillus micheneri]
MKKYIIQTLIYTKYFLKVSYDNKVAFFYSALFPIVMLILQSRSIMFQPISVKNFNSKVLPWISLLIFSYIIYTIIDLIQLREQGYMKQYSSLVINQSVFILSKLIVNIIVLFITTICTAIICSLLFSINPFIMATKLILLVIITYIPLVCICLPLLSLSIKRKTIPILVNIIMIILLIMSFSIFSIYNIKTTNVIMNLIDPLFFINNVFMFITGNINTIGFTKCYCMIFLINLIIGVIGYKKMLILPTES